jgi:hypothetical protein
MQTLGHKKTIYIEMLYVKMKVGLAGPRAFFRRFFNGIAVVRACVVLLQLYRHGVVGELYSVG